MFQKVCIFMLGFFLSYSVHASIKCPADITISCTQNPNNLSLTGTPTVFNASGQLTYTDQRTHTQCNAGSIVRTWFLDTNGNSTYDQGELACFQNITITYIPGTVTVTFPADREFDCIEAIQNENPTWHSTSPCDIIGISKQDIVFEADGNSCYKILRNWTVINWCTYVPGTNTGIWTHTQIIKVVDKSVPVIQECKSITLGTDKGCEGTFSVSNRAIDRSPCGHQILLWTAEVDLWADGSVEYTYRHNHPDENFRLDTVRSNQSVILTLPWPVRRGMHKVTWTVHDLCGNVSTCTQTVFLRDDKKPTPYLHSILSTAFDAKQMNLMIPARIFNLGSFDNCSHSRFLRYSFSPNVNDTIRTIDCNTAGFNFFSIFVTDHDGNQAEAEVIVLAFDNGSCGNKVSLKGTILEADNQPVVGAQFRMLVDGDPNNINLATSANDGSFTFTNTALYRNNVVEPMSSNLGARTVDIADLRMLQDYLMGLGQLKSYQFVAADLDGDQRLRASDLMVLRDKIMYPNKYSDDNNWEYICATKNITGPEMLKNISSSVTLKEAQGPLNFRAVFMGDISDANSKNTQPRTQFSIVQKTNGPSYEFLVENDALVNGLQLEVALPVGLTSISSSHFDVPSQSAYIDDNNILRVLISHDIILSKDEPLFTVSLESENTQSPEILANSKILTEGYRTKNIVVKGNQNSLVERFISPNPTHDKFSLSNPSAKVLKIFNTMGAEFNFTQMDNQVNWDAAPGIYLVQIQWDEDNITTEKIVRN